MRSCKSKGKQSKANDYLTQTYIDRKHYIHIHGELYKRQRCLKRNKDYTMQNYCYSLIASQIMEGQKKMFIDMKYINIHYTTIKYLF